ncbi:MAG: DUF2927 domain-containing protein [Paracoccus sp. (in: a-proteobacteria)]|nr:DUF2927 domain-containing protein [Paracoccus sp. (in: a-proteobacteria)]
MTKARHDPRPVPLRAVLLRPAIAAPVLLSAALFTLTSCDRAEAPTATQPAPVALAPEPRPDNITPRAAPPAARPNAIIRAARVEENIRAAGQAQSLAQNPASQALSSYYRTVQGELLSRNLLRPADAADISALDAATLARNFVDIALYDEYYREGDRLIPGPVPAPLRRWNDPVRVQIVFGESVAPAARTRDRAAIARQSAALGAISGHSVAVVPSGGNFIVMVLSEAERRALSPTAYPGLADLPPADLASMRNMPRDNYCAVFAYSLEGQPGYVQAVALIRSELPSRLRQSCIHEELAQGMGLANDSPRANPSIFNDNMTYGEMTPHDALLLKLLYDPRLRPGMTEAEATPIIRRIAGELVARPSAP